MQIRHPTPANRDELADLWAACFPEDTPAQAQAYFAAFYIEELTWVVQSGGQIIAMLQTVPYTLSVRGKAVEAKTFTGVCVHPDYRGQGVAGALMQHALLEAGKESLPLFFLNTDLPSVYSGIGFAPVTHNALSIPQGPDIACRIETTASPSAILLKKANKTYNTWNKPYNLYTIRDLPAFRRMAALEKIFGAVWHIADQAYAITEGQKIIEIVWANPAAAQALLAHLNLTVTPPRNMARAVCLPALCQGLQTAENGEITLKITDPVFPPQSLTFIAQNGRLSIIKTQEAPQTIITTAALTQWLTGYPTNLPDYMLRMLPPQHNIMFEIM
ncbi:MAG: GNAT family N-acetyltransferase [Clostridia bacterium]|nr:GNAT family N-acetyltransferase [Clostridia bacterium]